MAQSAVWLPVGLFPCPAGRTLLHLFPLNVCTYRVRSKGYRWRVIPERRRGFPAHAVIQRPACSCQRRS
ncbi:hypothetical protein C8F01DRAFT_1363410 [Mycena amicta]|nr:hypothetical protein C8F01DRAFT_1363410 [Mycena amicta]